MRGDLGTWDTSLGLLLGIVLVCLQPPLMFTSIATLLSTLAVVATLFAAFLLRASHGRRPPLIFLNAPIAAWSVFWTLQGNPDSTLHPSMLAPSLIVVGCTLLVLSVSTYFRSRKTG